MKTQIDAVLEIYLKESEDFLILDHSFHEIMSYSLAGGKRLRSVMFLLFARAAGLEIHEVKNYLIAIELLHAYSLIHDDLPAIDNDDLRRGRPSCHKKFGEGMAILAADAFHTLAFELITKRTGFDCENILEVAHFLAQTIGINGLIGGEILDVRASKMKETLDQEKILKIQRLKTAKFFEFCASAPCMLGGNYDLEEIANLKMLGLDFGLAFQILDDVGDFGNKPHELNILQGATKEQALRMVHKLVSDIEIRIPSLQLDRKLEQDLRQLMIENLARKEYRLD